jgi:hypothetical protein
MINLAFTILSIIILSGGGILMAKQIDQKQRDRKRKTYRLSFPSDLDPDRVTAWLRSISGTLRSKGMLQGSPSIVLEVWATNQGIQHYLKVPWTYEPYIRPNLESLIPGIRLTPEEGPPVRVWVQAVEAGLKQSVRQLRIFNSADVSTTILANFGTLGEHETLMMQWVITPATPAHKPVYSQAKTAEFTISSLWRGTEAGRDEVEDRRSKLEEPNMMAVLRVASVAETKIRAQFLVRGVMSALDSSRGPATHFYKRLVSDKAAQDRIDTGMSPLSYPIQLSAPELTAVIGWPLGNPMVAGLPAAVSRYLPTPESVPKDGRVLGISTFPGRERKIAVSYDEARKHVHVLGGTGSGKTTLLANMFRQDVEAEFGVVMIEDKGDLFKKALDYIPPNRVNDVIVFDVNDDKMPVGYNILQQGNPATVVDDLNMLFNALYKDHPSLWMQEAMHHGLHTLAANKGTTFIDLLALVSPTDDEVDWSERMKANVKDPQLKRYWQEFANRGKRDQEARIAPLASRVWPMSRTKLLNIVGQSKSTFYMDDVVKQNKILLVNLSGIERGSATLMGTLLLNSLWNSVKTHHSQKGMFLYLDEFHHYMNLPVDLQEMLVEARSMGLGMVLAHQYLDQLTAPNMEEAIMSNAKTKVTFQLGAADARAMSNNFGKSISPEDLLHLAKYEAVSRVSTGDGVSAPLTLSTMAPLPGYGNGEQIRYASRGRYGRPASEVQDEIYSRRSSENNPRQFRPRPKADGWGDIG